MPDDRRRRRPGEKVRPEPPAWVVEELRNVMGQLVEEGATVTQAASVVALAMARVCGELVRAHLAGLRS